MRKMKMKFREGIQGIFKSRGMLHLIVLMAMLFSSLEVLADLQLYLTPKGINGRQIVFSSDAGDVTGTSVTFKDLDCGEYSIFVHAKNSSGSIRFWE